jgi:hypothetical protein
LNFWRDIFKSDETLVGLSEPPQKNNYKTNKPYKNKNSTKKQIICYKCGKIGNYKNEIKTKKKMN